MIKITNNLLVGHIAMWLYRLAPKHQPRKADIIMKHVNSRIDSVFDIPIKHDPEFKIRDFEDGNDLYKFVDELMKNIKEFRELNLTWQEYEAGVDVDSPDRDEGIVFTSMYDVKSSEDWYTKDFIDLDAFVQDVVYSVLLEEEAENESI